MTDDIGTRLNTEEMTKAFYRAFPTVVTVEDMMRQALELDFEIERLQEENETLKRLAFPRQNPEYKYFIHPDAVNNYVKIIRGEQ